MNIDNIKLSKGAHEPGEGTCLMEAVALLAGESHSDSPECSSEVLAAFGRGLNDALLPERQDLEPRLRALAPKLINTIGRPDVDQQAGLMAARWLINVNLPAWLRLAGFQEHAENLANAKFNSWDELPVEQLEAAQDTTRYTAENAAWYAARSAAWKAAWDTASNAIWYAAWEAASNAASWYAAQSAAWLAAAKAISDNKDLQPIVRELQDSALALFEDMVELYQ